MNDKIRVVMLGPSLLQQGGMATVENLIINQPALGLDIAHIATHDEGSLTHRFLVFAMGLRQFLLSLIGHRCDVVHIHVSERGSVLRVGILVWLSALWRKPVLMHTHGCEFHVFFAQLPRLLRWWVALTFRSCAVVIALSDSWRDYYIEHCRLDPNRVVVLLNPVQIPDNLPSRSPTAAPLKFIFLGRIGERKGAFDVIQAVAQLPPPQRQRLTLWLAGDGEVERANQLIQQLELQDSIQLLGWINSETRDRLLSQADVFLLPSQNEGLPVAMLEAMAWGLPVIVTPVGGIPELVTHQQHGFFVPPGDVDAIADAMQMLLTQDMLRQQMGLAAHQQVQRLDVRQYRQVLLQLYTMAHTLPLGQVQRQPLTDVIGFSREKV